MSSNRKNKKKNLKEELDDTNKINTKEESNTETKQKYSKPLLKNKRKKAENTSNNNLKISNRNNISINLDHYDQTFDEIKNEDNENINFIGTNKFLEEGINLSDEEMIFFGESKKKSFLSTNNLFNQSNNSSTVKDLPKLNQISRKQKQREYFQGKVNNYYLIIFINYQFL